MSPTEDNYLSIGFVTSRKLREKIDLALMNSGDFLIGSGKSMCAFHAYPTFIRIFNEQPKLYELSGYLTGILSQIAGYGYLVANNGLEALVPFLALNISSGIYEVVLVSYKTLKGLDTESLNNKRNLD